MDEAAPATALSRMQTTDCLGFIVSSQTMAAAINAMSAVILI